ncbi:hypothetical protein PQO03_11970 [Lentisphaera profundi]|uniref:Polysaccharide chain length determinant N-terminal domain-containing protein n=1 Tax=Lentisphaera profundi TaxID=1658616 RepID=A0ABY7VWE3_9BACT|nr:hypothetical protein [Lentisphaera profundi]WDE98556.1 hypothetical protein PQO03_11970 [Lentisphaera profundi]
MNPSNHINKKNLEQEKTLSFRSFKNASSVISNFVDPNSTDQIESEVISNFKSVVEPSQTSKLEMHSKHPFTEKVVRAFNKKDILANFDWKKIAHDSRKRLPYLLLLIVLCTSVATYFTHEMWNEKQRFFASHKLLYKEVKFQNKQILPTSTSLTMIEHKETLNKALDLLPTVQTLDELKAAVDIQFDNKNKMVRVEFTHSDKELAIEASNLLGQLAVEANKKFYYDYFLEKFSNLSSQVLMTEQKMAVQDKLIADAMKKTGALNIREQYRILMESISLQERNLLEAEIDYSKRNVELKVLKSEYAKMPDEVVRNSYEDNPLKAQLTNTKMALLSAQSIYGEGNPNVQAIKEKISGLKTQLASQDIQSTLQKVYMPNVRKKEIYMQIAQADGALESAKNRIESIQLNIKEGQQKLYQVPDKEMKLDDSLRKKEALSELLDNLRKKQQDVEIMMRSEIKDLVPYEFADSARLIKPMKLLAVPPLVLIFTIGLALVYLTYSCVFDQSINTKKQISINFTIPCIMQLESGEDFDEDIFKGLEKTLDSNTHLQLKKIVSIQSKEGTHTASHAAKYFAERGQKVLFCTYQDLSTDQESKAHLLNDYHAGEDQLDNFVQEGDFDQVCFCAQDNAIPKELIDTLQQLSFHYDRVIIDIPTTECGKAEIDLINFADWFFCVVDARKAKRKTLVNRLKDFEFKGVCPEGFILDKVNSSLIQV